MPKGEHFKKPNPRINQVSFKVNDKELAALKSICNTAGLSIPEWIRKQIELENSGAPKRPATKPLKSKDNQISLF
jgi:hypothetical protein